MHVSWRLHGKCTLGMSGAVLVVDPLRFRSLAMGKQWAGVADASPAADIYAGDPI